MLKCDDKAAQSAFVLWVTEFEFHVCVSLAKKLTFPSFASATEHGKLVAGFSFSVEICDANPLRLHR
jgi:hypothetical protein